MIMFENFGYYLEGFRNFVKTGDVLSKKERMLLEWCNYLLDNTKFKNIVLNRFNNITFESKNRLFTMSLKESRIAKDHFDILLDYEFKPNRKFIDKQTDIASDFYKKGKSSIMFDYDSLMKWFKKRNYLKG